MLLAEYETILVLRPDLNTNELKSSLDRIENSLYLPNKLLSIDNWGSKKLAYEIKKYDRGIYFYTHYLGSNETVAEIERQLRLSDSILRFLTVKIADNVNVDDYEVKEKQNLPIEEKPLSQEI